MFHQRGEPGLFAVQEASDECLLKEVHKVDRPEQAAQLLCRLEGSFKIHFHFPVQEIFLFQSLISFLRRTHTNPTWWILVLAPAFSPKPMWTAAPWFTSGQR